MSGRRAAAISFGLILDLAERLDAAGVPPGRAMTLEQAVDLTWPLAKQLAKLERTARKAGASASAAREALLGSVVSSVTAPAPAPAPGPVALPGAVARRFARFSADQWHVALVPGPASDRDREREVA